jgi:hypothetical protein
VDVNPAKHYCLSLRYRTENAALESLVVKTGFFRDGKPAGTQEVYLDQASAWRAVEVLYLLPADANQMGIELGFRGPGRVWYDQAAIREISSKDAARLGLCGKMEPLAIPPAKRLPTVASNGFFQVGQSGGVWWMFDPAGRAFWSVGVCGLGAPGENPALSRVIEEQSQGGTGKLRYLSQVMQRARAWNFNSAGAWSGQYSQALPLLRQSGAATLPYFRVIRSLDPEVLRRAGKSKPERLALVDQSGAMMRPRYWENCLPDVFDPDWRRGFDAFARDVAREDPSSDLVAYFVDNEIQWTGIHRYLQSAACRRELIRWLRAKYGNDVRALNAAWKTELKDFEAAATQVKDIGRNQPAFPDVRAFVRHLVQEYVTATTRALRSADPRRIVISNRFNPPQALGSVPAFQEEVGDFLDLFSAYDVIGVNLYPMGGDHFTEDQIACLEWIHRKTGRPILIGEWAIHSDESGIRARRWRFNTVATDAARSQGYANCMAQLALLPYVVGAHWFKWANGYGSDGNDSRNSGLLDDANVPYESFVKRISAVNRQVQNAQRDPEFVPPKTPRKSKLLSV